LYARACRAQGEAQDCSALAAEAVKLREVRAAVMGTCERAPQHLISASHPVPWRRSQALVAQLNSAAVDGGSLPALRSHLWLAGAEAERAAQTLRCARPVFDAHAFLGAVMR
jgi:MoxR-like ATPase